MMARGRAARGSACRRIFKAEPVRAAVGRLAPAALPAAQHEGLGPHKLDVDPEVAHPSARRRVEPAHKLAQAVAVRDDVDLGPIDGRFLVVYLVCSNEEGKHRILGQACAILIAVPVSLPGPSVNGTARPVHMDGEPEQTVLMSDTVWTDLKVRNVCRTWDYNRRFLLVDPIV